VHDQDPKGESNSEKLGALVVVKDGITFNIGTGFTMAQREQFRKDRLKLVGQLVKFKSLEIGVKRAPRHPVFIGFRSKEECL
jgi:DNA ligase-1